MLQLRSLASCMSWDAYQRMARLVKVGSQAAEIRYLSTPLACLSGHVLYGTFLPLLRPTYTTSRSRSLFILNRVSADWGTNIIH